jgi:hypothetical protein
MIFLYYLFILAIYPLITIFLCKNNILAWLIFNIPIIIIELVGYKNRNDLRTLKHNESIFFQHIQNIEEFINIIWEEYGRIDNRYLDKNRHYVWNFELGNVILVILLGFAYFYNLNKSNLFILLILQIINCILYFITYFYDYFKYKNMRNKNIDNIFIFKQILYLSISSIWIIVPFYLL